MLVLESIKLSWELLFYLSMKIQNSVGGGTLCIHHRFFRGCQSYIFSLYIKANIVFRLSKYPCFRIDKNILGIIILFFYLNQKYRPQGGPFVYISDFFEGVKVNFFSFISKQLLIIPIIL